MDKATIAKYQAGPGRAQYDGPVQVPPENHAVVRLFERSLTQRRFAGMAAVCVGLDYSGVEAAARMGGSEMTAGRLDDLRVMEAEMLAFMSERRGKA